MRSCDLWGGACDLWGGHVTCRRACDQWREGHVTCGEGHDSAIIINRTS